ncbi:MAG TPA: dihydropteroate synthase [Bryobacteraceae bacterium]|nr:dihydropteroate synthase [Bryobacteraceae bacterium]
MPRRLIDWKFKKQVLHLGERTLIVGILNVTPDSPADEGRYQEPELAYVRAMEMAEQYADIVEIGAQSWRPGVARISEAEEKRRLIPVLKRLRGKLGVPVCVETCNAAVAAQALEMDVEILKDPTGLTIEPALAKIVLQHDAGMVVQHMRGTPEQWSKQPQIKDPSGAAVAELSASAGRAISAGVPKDHIAIDPGFGLGKRKEQNTELLSRLDRIAALGFPLQVSPAGKPFATDPPCETTFSLAVAVAMASVLSGAHMVRVHDVAGIRPAVLLADELMRGK